MDAIRRRAALAWMALAAGMVTGCATRAPAPQAAPPHRYTETISSVLVSEDGRRIAAILFLTRARDH